MPGQQQGATLISSIAQLAPWAAQGVWLQQCHRKTGITGKCTLGWISAAAWGCAALRVCGGGTATCQGVKTTARAGETEGELTDSTTGRECQMHTHTWTVRARSLDPSGHSLLGIFPVGFYYNLKVSKNPHRNPVPSLDCLVEAVFSGARSRRRHKGDQKAGASPGDHQLRHSQTTETYAGPTEPRGTENVLHPFIKQLDLQTSLFYYESLHQWQWPANILVT